jgi:acyl carrier protein
MNEEKILAIIADTLELDSVEVTKVLDERVWDSLAIVVFIGAVNNAFDKILDPSKLADVKNVQQLMQLVIDS